MVELVYDAAEGGLGDTGVRRGTDRTEPGSWPGAPALDGLTVTALPKDVRAIVAKIKGHFPSSGRWEIDRLHGTRSISSLTADTADTTQTAQSIHDTGPTWPGPSSPARTRARRVRYRPAQLARDHARRSRRRKLHPPQILSHPL